MSSEYALGTTYLNTAAHGLLPARSSAALGTAVTEMATGTLDHAAYLRTIESARSAFARLVGVPAEQVATGSSVAVHCALIAGALPAGAEVLVPENEFSSVVTPFDQRGDLSLRQVPLERLADSVRPETALVAFSAVQSLDGRVADLAGIRAAARRHGARTLLDATQAAGWLPVSAADFDYTVCGAYKWLLGPRGTSFLTVPPDGGGLRPLHAGWLAGENPWDSCYGPVRRTASSARRYDEAAPYLPYIGAAPSLALIEEIGVERIGAHDRALAGRFRAGATERGLPPVPADSPIVSLPGGGDAVRRLEQAGVRASVRGGDLRISFHLYNTVADVDRALAALT
ncbi:aminotransferase class V-fold PLP-dependent enzyme [Streptomyces sp. ACA25]|uniref:aminotransferase class V-fold PLP-dependent enzyme n=1 Tax=Streptomyces sp. ACA25 TaxID=3022596 RepID=UPI0023074660|nr:aminotransferase class V-fold PLP-dependent enzyme [Streptomyces sp. ACA25]MDB1089761.1 aminotransferase class V-fold PLP-dependent enzyme [Streptomyces sp. ACA25]